MLCAPTVPCCLWLPALPARPPACRYWEEKGFVVMLTARVLNLAALAFTCERGAACCLLASMPFCLLHC